jgi:hypothetical protein
VNEWLLRTRRALFFAGAYAVVTIRALDGWSRLSSKRPSNEVRHVLEGRFEFDRIAPLLAATEQTEVND